MKKFTAILLCLVFIISLAACGSREENEEKRGIKINRVYITSDEAAEKFTKEKGVY